MDETCFVPIHFGLTNCVIKRISREGPCTFGWAESTNASVRMGLLPVALFFRV
jgi:hypothetical protein